MIFKDKEVIDRINLLEKKVENLQKHLTAILLDSGHKQERKRDKGFDWQATAHRLGYADDKQMLIELYEKFNSYVKMNSVIKCNSSSSIAKRMRHHGIWKRKRAFGFRKRK